VTISVNTMYSDAPKVGREPVVLVDLIQESKAKEERREEQSQRLLNT
jgi:hypothetical protein